MDANGNLLAVNGGSIANNYAGSVVRVNALTGAQTLTTGNHQTFTLANLAGLTDPTHRVARFTLTLTAANSGIFSTDLKENAAGIPCITEINAGRFSSATNIFDFTGKHNMAVTYVRLARGEPPDMVGEYDVSEDHYMLRDIDALPRMFRAEEFFDAVEDARS